MEPLSLPVLLRARCHATRPSRDGRKLEEIHIPRLVQCSRRGDRGAITTAIHPPIRTSLLSHSFTGTDCDPPGSYHPPTSPSALVHIALSFSVSCFQSHFYLHSNVPTSTPSCSGHATPASSQAQLSQTWPTLPAPTPPLVAPGQEWTQFSLSLSPELDPNAIWAGAASSRRPSVDLPNVKALGHPTLSTCQLPTFVQGKPGRTQPWGARQCGETLSAD